MKIRFLELVHGYETALVASGYNPHVVRFHLHAVAHFGVWLELKGAELGTMDEGTVAAFERHRARCKCPGASRSRRRAVISCVRVFLHHLRQQGIVARADPPAEASPLVGGFLEWMMTHRGCVETTLATYRLYVTNLTGFLGEDPQTYTAKGLREFIAKRYRHYLAIRSGAVENIPFSGNPKAGVSSRSLQRHEQLPSGESQHGPQYSGTFGQIRTSMNPRIMQFALKYVF